MANRFDWQSRLATTYQSFPEASRRPLIGITGNYGEQNCKLGEGYYKSIWQAGGVPVVIPPLNDVEAVINTLDRLDGLLLSGGADINPLYAGEEPSPRLGGINAERDLPELLITRLAYNRQLPMLGICRGIQTLAMALGGKVCQDISDVAQVRHSQDADRSEATHSVTLAPDSILYHIYKDSATVPAASTAGSPSAPVPAVSAAGSPSATVPAVSTAGPPSVPDSLDLDSPTFVPTVKVGKVLEGGDSIQYMEMNNVYVFPPVAFESKKQAKAYMRLVKNVKTVLPLAKEANMIMMETAEFLETLPDKKAKDEHMKRVEKSIMKEYKPRMKKLTYSQGKLLIKLIYRESHSSSYELIQAFLGPLRAGFYQAFAWAFGASLK